MERLSSLFKDRKAQLGLNTVKAVMIAFLVLAVIAIAIVLTMVSLREPIEEIDTTTLVIRNTTTASVVNYTGAIITGTSGLRNCILSIDFATNASDGVLIPTANRTISGCSVLRVDNPSDNNFNNNTLWNISGSYTYSDSRTYDVERNITAGVTNFFDNTSTIFAILVVVVIILAISIIIAVVSKFGGGGGTGGSGSITGGGKEFGSDTVMGI